MLTPDWPRSQPELHTHTRARAHTHTHSPDKSLCKHKTADRLLSTWARELIKESKSWMLMRGKGGRRQRATHNNQHRFHRSVFCTISRIGSVRRPGEGKKRRGALKHIRETRTAKKTSLNAPHSPRRIYCRLMAAAIHHREPRHQAAGLVPPFLIKCVWFTIHILSTDDNLALLFPTEGVRKKSKTTLTWIFFLLSHLLVWICV